MAALIGTRAKNALVGLLCVFCTELAGCASLKAPVEDPREVWCSENQPRRDATEKTPRWELDEINAFNRKGAEWCGWRP